MPIYKAVTTSGREYEIDVDRGFWSCGGEVSLERIWEFQTATNPSTLPWSPRKDDAIEPEWKAAAAPEVGKKMYLASLNYWRISTEVVSVEILEDFDE